MVDFASGLCYGIGGQMERVGLHIYLLTPANAQVSEEDRRRLEARGS
jgi:cell division inhibitor SepF